MAHRKARSIECPPVKPLTRIRVTRDGGLAQADANQPIFCQNYDRSTAITEAVLRDGTGSVYRMR